MKAKGISCEVGLLVLLTYALVAVATHAQENCTPVHFERGKSSAIMCAEREGVPEFGRRRVQEPTEKATYLVQPAIGCIGGYDLWSAKLDPSRRDRGFLALLPRPEAAPARSYSYPARPRRRRS
jgi:hypothetical protein